MATAEAHRVIVYGGRGALGSACVQYFKSKSWVSQSEMKESFHLSVFYFCCILFYFCMVILLPIFYLNCIKYC